MATITETDANKAIAMSFVSYVDQRRRLRMESARLDVPMSAVIRLAIDEYLKSA
jgi:hypothetical protein